MEQLDKKAEMTMLSPQEMDVKHCLKIRLMQLLREEEIKWYQRSKANNLLQGDSNTNYFHLVANGKRRKSRIFQLEDGDCIIKGEEPLKSYITDYYKKLFCPPDSGQFSLDEDKHNDIVQITPGENEKLTSVINEQEVKDAVFQMKHNKAPGPDGFPAEFYQIFWETIKKDLMALFKDFYEDKLPFFSLNFGTMTLLPKQKEATHIRQFRPICLLNVSFKIFTKVMVNRLTGIATRLINPSQTAFIPGRNIMEGVVMLHETIHELHKKKMSGVILKLDFEKAYDKVNWDFLQRTLRIKGFSRKWCHWIDQMVSKGSVGVKVNDNTGRYFQTKKGLRQGDPLSPILFNLVADMLSTLINRAKDDDQIRGLVPHLIQGGAFYLTICG
jgi:hypothetical protein